MCNINAPTHTVVQLRITMKINRLNHHPNPSKRRRYLQTFLSSWSLIKSKICSEFLTTHSPNKSNAKLISNAAKSEFLMSVHIELILLIRLLLSVHQ